MTSSAMPAFGEADLSNCEREQIQFAGSIQPHGVLLVLDESAATVIQASANARTALGLAADPVGMRLTELPGTLAERLPALLREPLHRRPALLRVVIGPDEIAYDCLVHRPSDGGLIVELEPPGEPLPLAEAMSGAARIVAEAATLPELCNAVAALVSDLVRYDRVMVYRFDDLGHGEVFSECRRGEHEAFLGNRYPSSDIPQMARRLYLDTRVRLLVDVGYAAVPLVPRSCPLSGQDLDMSLCDLRSMSPIHLQYLKNMGVRATLVVSLVVGGRLWGLIACHHYAPRFVALQSRAFLEVVAELVATKITSLRSLEFCRAERLVARLDAALRTAVGNGDAWPQAVLAHRDDLLATLGAGGMALSAGGAVLTAGATPDSAWIVRLVEWLDTHRRQGVVHTAALTRDAPHLAPDLATVAGIAAVRLSGMPGEWLVWCRPERVRTVTWGGDPTKPVIVGADPRQLSPRLSFAQWFEKVEGTADPWTDADLATAGAFGHVVADAALRSRSIDMLVARDRLDGLSRQLHASDQPSVLADASGRVILVNGAFEALLQAGHSSLQRLDDLPHLFTRPLLIRQRLEDLQHEGRSWSGEAALAHLAGDERPVAVDAVAILGEGGRLLGCTIRFAPIADRRLAERAREHFAEELADRLASPASPLTADPLRGALDVVVETARHAVLDVTYGHDAEALPRLLEAVRASVERSAELIAHLSRHDAETIVSRDPSFNDGKSTR